MALLRKIEHCVNGVSPAWEETFMNWNLLSKNLSSYPKAKSEDGQVEPFHRSMGKRRASHQNSEHELEVRFLYCIIFIDNKTSIHYFYFIELK